MRVAPRDPDDLSGPWKEVIAHWFGLSQPQANFLIHPLSAVLATALAAAGHSPARLTNGMRARLAEEMPQDLGIDGTERRVQRPEDPAGQRAHYSGKKTEHCPLYVASIFCGA